MGNRRVRLWFAGVSASGAGLEAATGERRTHAELLSESSAFPEVFVNFYGTGEVSGQIDSSLIRLHTYFQEDAERKTRALAEWSPRVIYFIIVLAIAYQIISFWTGYFSGIANALNF